MARYRIVDTATGLPVNVIIWDGEGELALPEGHVAELDDGSPLPAPPVLVPTIISDRQFFQQLAIDGVITEDEALATADGTMPALLMSIIAMLPAEAQFSAKMLVKNATTFDRTHPLTAVIGQALGWTDDRLDRLWFDANLL